MTPIIPIQLTRAQERLAALKIPLSIFAQAIGLTPSALSQATRGVFRLSAGKEREVAEVSLMLVELNDALRPVEISRDPDNLRVVVQHIQKHGVDPQAVREAMSRLFSE